MPKDSRPNEGAHTHDDRDLSKHQHPNANAFVKESVEDAVAAAREDAEAAGVTPSAVMYSAPDGYGLGHGSAFKTDVHQEAEGGKPAGRATYERETAG